MKSNQRKNEIRKHLRVLIPNVTMEDFLEIEAIADAGHLRHLPPSIIAWQAITTRIRHAHTEYDELLKEGYDAESARHFVIDAINDKLAEWGATKTLSED